jgi:protein O-mannosyl-transferase
MGRQHARRAKGSGPTAARPEAPARPAGARELRLAVAIAILLAACTVAVYAPVRHFGFVEVDDPQYVPENPIVTGGLTWGGVVAAFTTSHAAYWIPVTWLSYMAEVSAFGVDPGVHHATNLLLHVANTLLLFLVLRRMTGATVRSAFVAALFAVHPLHVESVAWITERKDVLSGFFWMLALWSYARYVDRPGPARYAWVAAWLSLGLMAKPMLVTLPVVMLLLDVWPLGRLGTGGVDAAREAPGGPRPRWTALAVEKVPLLLVVMVFSAIAFVTQSAGGATPTLQAVPLALRVQNALVSYVTYIGQTLWPAGLTMLYPLQPAVPISWAVGSAVVMLAASAAAVLATARRPYVLVGWFWFVVTLVPVIGLVQAGLQARADRFTYLPLVGLFIVASWGAADLFARRPSLRTVPLAAGALVVIALGVVSRGQVAYWQDNVTLWTRALQVTLGVDQFDAHLSLGRVLKSKGRLVEAETHLAEAARLKPGSADARYAYGVVLLDQKKLDRAEAEFAEVLRLDPGRAEARAELGLVRSYQGKTDEAIALYQEALRANRELAEVQNNLGALLAERGDLDGALPHFQEASRLKPNLDTAHVNLGVALARLGRLDEATAEATEALRLNPGNEAARRLLGELTRR